MERQSQHEVRKQRKPESALMKAIAKTGTDALYAGAVIAGISSPAEGQTTREVQKIEWFTQKMSEHTLSKRDFAKMESIVNERDFPLRGKITFLNRVLGEGGEYYQELQQPLLGAARVSDIMNLVNEVSAQLTIAYEQNQSDPRYKEYFDIGKVAASSRQFKIRVLESGGLRTCSGFIAINVHPATKEKEAYFVTAEHCVEGTDEVEKYHVNKAAGQAIRYIPPSEFADPRWNITNIDALPIFTLGETQKSESGKVVVSYSVGGDAEFKQKTKVHFSFALPTPYSFRGHLFQGYDTARVDKEMPTIQHSMLMVKPEEEARPRIKGPIDPKTNKPYGTVTGSSGSIIAKHDTDGYHVLASLNIAKYLDDTCRMLCLGLAFGSGPETLSQLIQDERDVRRGHFRTLGRPHYDHDPDRPVITPQPDHDVTGLTFSLDFRHKGREITKEKTVTTLPPAKKAPRDTRGKRIR